MICKGLIATAVCFLIAAAASAWGWLSLPPGASVPVHFGPDGTPDRYGGKAEAFLFVPALVLGIGLLMAVLPRLDPRGDNLMRSSKSYLAGWIGGLAVAAFAQVFITWSALAGPSPQMIRLLGVGLSILFIVLGNFLGKARPNFFAGIRTPWTLTSDIAWEKTHRLAGWLFVGAGAAGLVWVLAAPLTLALTGQTALILIAAFVPVIYSYFAWRGAPDRRPGPQVED